MKKIFSLLFILITTSMLLYAQVDLEINDGMTIETTGGVYVELSGNLIENGTGYLKGVVTSGTRTANSLSQFAGLNITTGGVDKITRTTGTAISTSSPKTSLRSYNVVNTTGLTSAISSVYLESGSNDESNGILSPFLYRKVGTTWTGYTDNSTIVNSIGASNFNIPAGTSDIVISEGVGVAAKIYLQGPYNASNNDMDENLTAGLPLTSPYSEDTRTVSSIPANAVDWVLVQLRTETLAGTSAGYRSAFVKNDGNIIDDAGNVGIGLPAVPGSYYIAVKQRNHLAVMSAEVQTLSWFSAP